MPGAQRFLLHEEDALGERGAGGGDDLAEALVSFRGHLGREEQ